MKLVKDHRIRASSVAMKVLVQPVELKKERSRRQSSQFTGPSTSQPSLMVRVTEAKGLGRKTQTLFSKKYPAAFPRCAQAKKVLFSPVRFVSAL